MIPLQSQGGGLQSIAPELIFLLGAVIIISFIASTASAVYAQQRVANTIEVGVQGIVGINSMQEVRRAAETNVADDSESTASAVGTDADIDGDLEDVIEFLNDQNQE